MTVSVEVTQTPEYGAVLKCHDLEVADEFEDFLAEHCYVWFDVKFDDTSESFHFGEASAVDQVRELFRRFALMANIEVTGL